MTARVGIVGLGYWGPNLARNLNSLENCELAWCCDASDASRAKWQGAYPDARFTAEFDDLISDPDLDAIAITTPVPTHAELAERALEAGKHCFVEKPLAQDAASAERVAGLAEDRGLVLMAGHLLCYHPGVRQLADLIAQGELGEVYYLYSQRVNLGKLRAGVDARHFGLGTDRKGNLRPSLARQRNKIGEVIFAFGVCVADAGQQRIQHAGAERHHAGIA